MGPQLEITADKVYESTFRSAVKLNHKESSVISDETKITIKTIAAANLLLEVVTFKSKGQENLMSHNNNLRKKCSKLTNFHATVFRILSFE